MTLNQFTEFDRREASSACQRRGLEVGGRMNTFVRNSQNGAMAKVERSIGFMADNLNKPLQVATLAAMVNISPSHFFSLFKRRTGYSPMDYFTRLRMRHACQLLDATAARVKEIAAALGYEDPFYFSRVFKSLSAVAPVQYRGLGFDLKLAIKDLLEPKNQASSADSPARTEFGRTRPGAIQINRV